MHSPVSILVALFVGTTLATTHAFVAVPSSRVSIHHHQQGTTIIPTTATKGKGTRTIASRLEAGIPAVWTTLDAFWKTSPYAAGAVICGIKASAADWVAQRRAATTTSKRRNFAYLLYGAVYQGACQEFIYNHLYPVYFGMGTDWATVALKVVFDLCVQTPLVTLPIAYLCKAVIFQYSAKEAMKRYIHDIRHHGLLKKYFLLWGPVQCLTFSIVPEHWRVTFIASISFFWLIILSSIASRTKVPIVTEDDDDDVCELLDGQTCN